MNKDENDKCNAKKNHMLMKWKEKKCIVCIEYVCISVKSKFLHENDWKNFVGISAEDISLLKLLIYSKRKKENLLAEMLFSFGIEND